MDVKDILQSIRDKALERGVEWLGRSITQTLEPRAYFVRVPHRNQNLIPVFDSALADFNATQLFSENRYAGSDRIGDASQMTAMLTSRLIDRPIRPLFPEGFYNEVQVVPTVVSLDPEIDSDIPAMLGASAALALSGIPFKGPIGAARVGYVDGQYVLNPALSVLKTSKLDLVVAGTADAVLMVESEAKILPEDVMLGAVVYGHEQMQVAIKAIRELAAEAGKPAWAWTAPELDKELVSAVGALAEADLGKAYSIIEKQARYARIDEIKKAAVADNRVS